MAFYSENIDGNPIWRDLAHCGWGGGGVNEKKHGNGEKPSRITDAHLTSTQTKYLKLHRNQFGAEECGKSVGFSMRTACARGLPVRTPHRTLAAVYQMHCTQINEIIPHLLGAGWASVVSFSQPTASHKRSRAWTGRSERSKLRARLFENSSHFYNASSNNRIYFSRIKWYIQHADDFVVVSGMIASRWSRALFSIYTKSDRSTDSGARKGGDSAYSMNRRYGKLTSCDQTRQEADGGPASEEKTHPKRNEIWQNGNGTQPCHSSCTIRECWAWSDRRVSGESTGITGHI